MLDFIVMQMSGANREKGPTKQTVTTSKYSTEFTYGDFPCNFKVTRGKLALIYRRRIFKKAND